LGITGIERYFSRVWRLVTAIASADSSTEAAIPTDLDRKLHQTIASVTRSLEAFDFHGGLARLMELTNQIYSWVGSDLKDVHRSEATVFMAEMLARLLAPFAPHLSEELCERLAHSTTVFDEPWPIADEEKAREDRVTIAVQICGKLRGTVDVAADASEEALLAEVFALDKLKPYLDGKTVVKKIIVPGKIVNLVVK
ncbi:MAG: class I tRNA ligase family protein, partial [bacterium]|nr:class I tRNA ligase family protein [bacterium]